MRAIRKAGALLAGAAIAIAAGCRITPDDLVGRTCAVAADCPQGYACKALPTGTRGCVLDYPQGQDAGASPGGPSGPVLYYCSDIKPMLDYYCVTCHGPGQMQGGDFRLDYYERDGGPPGAHAEASLIKDTVALAQTMPPPDAGAFPSDLERARFAEWVDAGAPGCDAGSPGSADAGLDGGADGG